MPGPMLSQSVRSKRMDKPMSAIAGHAYCGGDTTTIIKTAKCQRDERDWGRRNVRPGRAGLTPNGRISRVNRWNACGKEALRSAKELSQRPAPQVKFPAESPRRLDEERLAVRWRRISLIDAPIAVEKNGGDRDGEQ